MTTYRICPGFNNLMPSFFEMSLACGGKIDDTRTRLYCAIPAERRAISKLDSFSRCFPTPWVRKIFFVTKAELIAGRLTDDGGPYKQIGHYRSVIHCDVVPEGDRVPSWINPPAARLCPRSRCRPGRYTPRPPRSPIWRLSPPTGEPATAGSCWL